MVSVLFDTNILIDYLNRIDAATHELRSSDAPKISVITWMEIMVGADPAKEAAIREWLKSFEVLPLTPAVSEMAVALRRERGRGLKLPDAIIWATARVHGAILSTRNTKDFPPDEPNVRIPYTL